MNKQTRKPVRLQGRILVFDFLRSVMIFFVIVLHTSMTYMLDSPSWWYVISHKTSAVFVVIVNVLDLFMMPVLFFISGYFTPASYLKKGTAGFLKNKIKHIFFPWIVGIMVIVPLYTLFLGKSPNDLMEILTENPFYLFHSQGHLWYLGVLFLFLAAYPFVARLAPPSSMRTAASGRTNRLWLLACMAVSASCSWLSVTYITPFDNWLYIASVFTLKPAKIITYLCIFMLGIYAWQTNWFTKGGFTPRTGVWFLWATGTATCYLTLRLLVIPRYDFPLLDKLVPVLDAVCSFTTLMYALPAGIKLQTSRLAGWLAKLSPYSYGIYWIHLLPLILYLRLINDWDFPVFIKWISGVCTTCLLSWLISKYVLKKWPAFRDMF
ncbi:MAG: acyltransferase [Tannerellaceae bacterium]|jgi:peptidoglycan/LPS O-acetylase OafA/YrhL|nr:acyltransferase [Tannerellaceae bacterium]